MQRDTKSLCSGNTPCITDSETSQCSTTNVSFLRVFAPVLPRAGPADDRTGEGVFRKRVRSVQRPERKAEMTTGP